MHVVLSGLLACVGGALLVGVAVAPLAAQQQLMTGLRLGWTDGNCNAAPGRFDDDHDGLDDLCELDLATAFAPTLVVAKGGCNWDTSVTPARLGGEYYFGVQRTQAGNIRVAYLPAYYRDCGWHGAKCRLPFVSCAPHDGDSELIALDLKYDDAMHHWSTVRAFLSAHCFSRTHRTCSWNNENDLRKFQWTAGIPGGAPVVYVAEGRQANYPTRGRCNRGHLFLDTCTHNDVRYRFPIVRAAQNIGSRRFPVSSAHGCVDRRQAGWASARVKRGTRECLWSSTVRFRGWQATSPAAPGATPYGRYLQDIMND